MKKYDIGVSLALIGLAIWVYLSTGTQGAAAPIGSELWPRILAVLLLILGGCLLLRSLVGESSPSPVSNREGLKRVGVAILILIGFAVLLQYVGFYFAGLFLIPSIMRLMHEKRPGVLIGITVGVLAFAYLVFEWLLRIPLPHGSLF